METGAGVKTTVSVGLNGKSVSELANSGNFHCSGHGEKTVIWP
jgi:hypothetical protein